MNIIHTFTFLDPNGTPFLARAVPYGGRYGAEMCLLNDTKAMVEFYDTRHPFAHDFVGSRDEAIAAGAPVLGQFITRYYISTLRETRHLNAGLCLHGGEPAWQLDPASMAAVHAWLDTVAPAPPVIIKTSV